MRLYPVFVFCREQDNVRVRARAMGEKKTDAIIIIGLGPIAPNVRLGHATTVVNAIESTTVSRLFSKNRAYGNRDRLPGKEA